MYCDMERREWGQLTDVVKKWNRYDLIGNVWVSKTNMAQEYVLKKTKNHIRNSEWMCDVMKNTGKM